MGRRTMSTQFPSDRVIQNFPKAYKSNCTPYVQEDFSVEVRNALNLTNPHRDAYVCKVIFVGDIAVGKTTIVKKFCLDNFEQSYKATIGVDFEIETIRILDQPHNLQIWDTAGQERFKCISQAYYRNSQVIAIVFDMTKPKTLEDTTCWLESALSVNTIEKPFLFLVGCKCDLLPQKEFEIMERNAMEMAKGMQAEYWSVSAKTGSNIQELFNRIAGLSFESSVKKSIIESAISLGGIRPSQISRQIYGVGKFRRADGKLDSSCRC